MADSFTKMINAYPTSSHGSDDVVEACQQFVGPADKVGLFYTDGAQELEPRRKRWSGDTIRPLLTGPRLTGWRSEQFALSRRAPEHF